MTKRPWLAWAMFGLCTAAVCAAMLWLTRAALQLDRARNDAERKAVLEENVRLALWRMDSALTPLLVRIDFRSQMLNMEEPLRVVSHVQLDSATIARLPPPQPRTALALQAPNAAPLQQSAKKGGFKSLEQQQALSKAEFQQRQVLASNTIDVASVTTGAVTPLWLSDQLVLARRVGEPNGDFAEAVALDWSKLDTWLRSLVQDLLPEARLVPAPNIPDESRQLASLPIMLEPGSIAWPSGDSFTPIHLALIVAWLCVTSSALAAAVMLWSIMRLSERRAAFVSAVTHELRTPLTTFRLYADMLAENAVGDETARRRYLDTLRCEAERLSHLVENVLAYARLERGRLRARTATVDVASILERVRERMAERVGAAGMRVECEAASGAVRADPEVVEQILVNLIDNACKYGRGGDNVIHISAAQRDGRVTVKVRDHGPGIGAAPRRRLFTPFAKSAHEAAESAPGVGLGLAISRRLARQMGGNLRQDTAIQDGAGFVLILPADDIG